jgi:hypothetical protein
MPAAPLCHASVGWHPVFPLAPFRGKKEWMPAFAGMTKTLFNLRRAADEQTDIKKVRCSSFWEHQWLDFFQRISSLEPWFF